MSLCAEAGIFDREVDESVLASKLTKSIAEPGKCPAVITKEMLPPTLLGDRVNTDVSLIQWVFSVAVKPDRTARDVANVPKFPPLNTELAPDVGKFKICDEFAKGRSNEKMKFPVATFLSIVTIMLLGNTPAASKHVNAESDSQLVELHAVWPMRVARYSLCGCRCCSFPKPLPAIVTIIFPLDGRFGKGSTVLGTDQSYSRSGQSTC
jgi:hypothetical protein